MFLQTGAGSEVVRPARAGLTEARLARRLSHGQASAGGAIALSVVLQIAVGQLEFLNDAFGTTPLSLEEWLICTGLASMVVWTSELRKLVANVWRSAEEEPLDQAQRDGDRCLRRVPPPQRRR